MGFCKCTKNKQKYAPLSVNMETTSIAHVCHANRIPFYRRFSSLHIRLCYKTGEEFLRLR